MTEPGPEAGPGPASDPEPGAGTPSPSSLGLFRFTIDGRQAPGLFVAGWLATLIGGFVAIVGVVAGRTAAGTILLFAGLTLLLLGLLFLGGVQSLERRAAGLAYAGPSPILVLGAVLVGPSVAAFFLTTPLALLGVRFDPLGLIVVGVLIQAIVVVGIVRLLVVGTGALSWAEMGLGGSPGRALRDMAWGAVYGPPAVLVSVLVVAALTVLVGQGAESPLPPTGTPIGLAVNLFAGALVVPIYEELVFRGFATTAWARVVGPVSAIARTSLLFAAAHIIGQSGPTFAEALGIAVVAAGARLPAGFILGWAYLRRGSLWASIGLHATYNAILLVLAEMALDNLPAG
ncbi:MAG: CPBP family intramembrane metalloprotease [Chloroflexi bacterium]|nr:CPBP family intramembrane metalloprotease [Chloroflexota bacterium]